MPRRPKPDLARIQADVRRYVGDGEKVRKVMACGHEDEVFPSVDATTSECWACRLGKQTGEAKPENS